jgi:hypothetical protein
MAPVSGSRDYGPRRNQWPLGPWPFTAPEAHALLQLGHEHLGASLGEDLRAFGLLRSPHSPRAFRLGLLELVARRLLELVETERRVIFGATTVTPVLTPGPLFPSERRPAPLVPAALQPLWDLYTNSPWSISQDGTAGVPLDSFICGAHYRYTDVIPPWGTSNLHRYERRAVVPALVARGLCAEEAGRTLGIFPRGRLVLTREGQAALAHLQKLLIRLFQDFPQWVSSDPPRALALVRQAGAAVLLGGVYLLARLAHQPDPPATNAAHEATGSAETLVIDSSIFADLGRIDAAIWAAIRVFEDRLEG